MNSRFFFGIILLAVLAGLSGWWLYQTERRAAEPLPEDRPDYYLEGFTATSYNLDGSRQNHIEGVRLEHFPVDDRTEILGARFTTYTDNRPLWNASSEKAKIVDEGKRILMLGETIINYTDVNRGGPAKVVTRDLTILPDEEYAESDAPTQITSPTTQVSATGVRLNMKDEQIKLLNAVTGSYNGE